MCRISPRFDLASGAKSNLGKIRGSRQARGRIAETREGWGRGAGRILGKCGIVIMK